MTTDRKKAALYLGVTLIAGMLLGALILGAFGRFRERGRSSHEGKKGGLSHFIERAVKPSAEQSAKIKPLAEKASARIEVLQGGCNAEIKTVLDSLRTQLQPILSKDQLEEFDEYLQKGRR